MSDRYKFIEGSESGHCCFEASVVDTWTTQLIAGKRYTGGDGNPACKQVCECFEPEDAAQICAALNMSVTI